MDPVGVVRSRKGWQVAHVCRTCGATRLNRAAVDTDQADDLDLLICLMTVTLE
ncbi:MAG: RNHCP domain-containing protein [Actinomycetota bacterium]